MTTFLIRLFIKDYENVKSQRVRQRYGQLGGAVGIVCNLVLFIAKFLAGLLTSSIAVTADAFNNLSDAGSSIVTLVGFRMAGKPADDQHPFGHGRIEYIAGLLVSIIILLMGIELGKSSVEKIMHPDIMDFSWLSFAILSVSICVKLWMGLFNRRLSRIIDSSAMRATAMDSISDVVATSTVVLGMFITKWTGYNVDGYSGVLVALFICYTGLTTIRDTLNPLLGQPPEQAFVDSIEQKVLSYKDIVGVHDLIVHNYGPGRSIVSLHAEVPCHADILQIHDTIDCIERELKKEFDCEAVIHMDPIVTDDIVTNEIKEKILDLVQTIDGSLKIHDFRIVKGPTHTNLIFDIVVPHQFRLNDQELCDVMEQKVKQLDTSYQLIMNIDKAYHCL